MAKFKNGGLRRETEADQEERDRVFELTESYA